MKKLILSVFLACLFSLSSQCTVSAAEDSKKTENPKAEQFMPSSHDVFSRQETGLFYDKETKNIGVVKDYTTGDDLNGETLFRNLMETLIEFLKKVLVPVTILLLGWSAIYLFLARGDAEELKKRRSELVGILGAFTLILISTSAVDNVFFGNEGQVLRSTCEGDAEQCIKQFGDEARGFAANGLKEINGLANFALSFVLALAVAFLVFSSYSLVFGGENEEAIDKAKNRVIYAIVGIAVIVSAQTIVHILTNNGGKISLPDITAVLGLGGFWTNKILGFLGLISVSALVWAGTQMIINFGNDERVENAKKIFQYVIIGLVLAFSMWTIIRFFLTAGAPYNLS